MSHFINEKHSIGTVLCCLCGASITPNGSNMCFNCIKTQVDITEGLQKQITVLWCKDCGRYLQPPKHWMFAAPESKELLTFCLKKIKGLSKVKLVDAAFIWTEPHSRRLKVKVTIQAEVSGGAILQQSFVVEYVVETHMCPDCERQNSNPNMWVAAVQVRQHVQHKRTFLYLEQLILKHGADINCINIKSIHQSVVPVRYRTDKQLVSHNIHTSSYKYKYTFSVEVVPICKDDLVCLPSKLASKFGNLSPLMICTKVTNLIALTDVTTLQTINIDAVTYWRFPFKSIMQSKQLQNFIVLDVELNGLKGNGYVSADVQIAKVSDFGVNDKTTFIKTHIGHILHSGDTVLGYDLLGAQTSDLDFDKVKDRILVPDCVLVKRSFEEKRRNRRSRGHKRNWKLKSIVTETEEMGNKRSHLDNEDEMEKFLEELEEDPELRGKICLFKNENCSINNEENNFDDDENILEIPITELLDDIAAMQIDD